VTPISVFAFSEWARRDAPFFCVRALSPVRSESDNEMKTDRLFDGELDGETTWPEKVNLVEVDFFKRGSDDAALQAAVDDAGDLEARRRWWPFVPWASLAVLVLVGLGLLVGAPQSAPDKTASDKTASDKTASDKTASDKTALDKTALDKIWKPQPGLETQNSVASTPPSAEVAVAPTAAVTDLAMAATRSADNPAGVGQIQQGLQVDQAPPDSSPAEAVALSASAPTAVSRLDAYLPQQDPLWPRLQRFEALYSKGRYAQALASVPDLEALLRSVDAVELRVSILGALAHAAAELGRLSSARTWAARAVALDARAALPHVVLGLVSQELGRAAEAETHYRRYLMRAPYGPFAADVRAVLGVDGLNWQ